MARLEVNYLNDNNIEVTGVKKAGTGSAVTDAVVTVTVVKRKGKAEVSGQTWPVTCSWVSASNLYRGVLQDVMVVKPEQELTAQLTVSGGAHLKGYWELPVIVKVRTE